METSKVRREAGVTVIEAAGDLDVASAPELRNLLSQEIDAGHTRLVVDLSEVPFVDSTGLGTLVAIMRQASQAGGALKLASPRDTVSRVLTLTRMREFFDVSNSVAESVRRFQAADT